MHSRTSLRAGAATKVAYVLVRLRWCGFHSMVHTIALIAALMHSHTSLRAGTAYRLARGRHSNQL